MQGEAWWVKLPQAGNSYERGGGEVSTIVVGVDSSEGAKEALRFALEEARLRDATVRAVHVWQYVPVGAGYVEAGFQVAEIDPAQLQSAAEAMLAASVAAVAGEDGGREVEQRVVQGAPAAALVEEARDADLVVVGSRGLGGFRGLLLGSVSHQVAQHATCPVVIVRPQAERES